MERKVIVRRIIAFTIDWIIVFCISLVVFFSDSRFSIDYLLRPSIQMFSSYGVILGCLCFIFLPLLKDCLFKNASFGKRIMGLRIVAASNNQHLSPGKIILRNITFYLPFIEFLFLLFNHGNTIGDMISFTTVVMKK